MIGHFKQNPANPPQIHNFGHMSDTVSNLSVAYHPGRRSRDHGRNLPEAMAGDPQSQGQGEITLFGLGFADRRLGLLILASMGVRMRTTRS